LKGFTKDGKFRPTGNKSKSSLKKSDIRNKGEFKDEFGRPTVFNPADNEYNHKQRKLEMHGIPNVATVIEYPKMKGKDDSVFYDGSIASRKADDGTIFLVDAVGEVDLHNLTDETYYIGDLNDKKLYKLQDEGKVELRSNNWFEVTEQSITGELGVESEPLESYDSAISNLDEMVNDHNKENDKKSDVKRSKQSLDERNALLQKLKTNGEELNGTLDIDFIQDNGHGWIKVPKLLVKGLQLNDEISEYSYKDSEFAYLEEDSDMPKLLKVLKDGDIPYSLNEIMVDGESPIRDYNRFK